MDTKNGWPGNTWEKAVLLQAKDIPRNGPVFAGDTLSHALAAECYKRGWIKRDDNGDWVPAPGCPFTTLDSTSGEAKR